MTFEEIEAVTAIIKQTVLEKAGSFSSIVGSKFTDADYQEAAIKVLHAAEQVREGLKK